MRSCATCVRDLWRARLTARALVAQPGGGAQGVDRSEARKGGRTRPHSPPASASSAMTATMLCTPSPAAQSFVLLSPLKSRRRNAVSRLPLHEAERAAPSSIIAADCPRSHRGCVPRRAQVIAVVGHGGIFTRILGVHLKNCGHAWVRKTLRSAAARPSASSTVS
eukprot:1965257-Pleurochrysis_carterae.AAC.5